MRRLQIYDVDITHERLVELFRLADHAYRFYEWVEQQFQHTTATDTTLDYLLQTSDHSTLTQAIIACYQAEEQSEVPQLFDGIGRPYTHSKACYYFFAWLIRDAPQQRLNPLIQRMAKSTNASRMTIEATVLAALIIDYRPYVQHFSWEAIREVIVARLEGSRRSLKGHIYEGIVRSALIDAIQDYYRQHKNYGLYSKATIARSQTTIGNQTYDASIQLLNPDGETAAHVLVAVKTRETKGGGHAHLFSRDVSAAITTAKTAHPSHYLLLVIIAQNWSGRELAGLQSIVDHLVVINHSPTQLGAFPDEEQQRLNRFITAVLNGQYQPKHE